MEGTREPRFASSPGLEANRGGGGDGEISAHDNVWCLHDFQPIEESTVAGGAGEEGGVVGV